MSKKPLPIVTVKLDRIVGGGQTIATLENGQKLFVWGGLPGETVNVQITKKKSKLSEGVVAETLQSSPERIEPRDPDSYLSTSPWQIMDFDAEQRHKTDLIYEAFELHKIQLPKNIEIYSDNKQYGYRNKVEFSWYWNKNTDTLDLAFFKRGSHGKIPVNSTSLAKPEINESAAAMRDILRKRNANGFDLKTLLVRCNAKGEVSLQLYVKDENFNPLSETELQELDVQGFELIYSNPQCPASVITKKLQSVGQNYLSDEILGKNFSYAVEGFFQINLPVYEQVLNDMKQWVDTNKPTVDLYSGVGSIGLTIGTDDLVMIESNQQAFDEMKRNIIHQKRQKTTNAILAPSEKVIDYITSSANIIFDPPRAGLHEEVINRLIEQKPRRILYLSCNPVTQARDTAKLIDIYKIVFARGYNFFPRTPHIENLIVLELI